MPSTITSPKTFRIPNNIIKVLDSESKKRKRSQAFLVNEALYEKYEQLIDSTKTKDK